MLYTTVLSGNILRMTPDGENQEVFVNTGGRVLDFDFDAEGNLIAADSIKGSLPKTPRKIFFVKRNFLLALFEKW